MTQLTLTSHDIEERSVSEVRFTEVENLPLFSRIYQSLKANPKTAWIASLIRNPIFWTILKVAALILYFGVGIAYYCRHQGWGVGSTIFYTIATVTTVGYGYHHPTDDDGRLFTIFYIFVGVYFIYLFVADSVIRFMNFTSTYFKSKLGKSDIATEYKQLNWMIYANIIAILLTLLIGAGCFCALEGWTFITALYFAVETSTTVGYGDITIDHKDQTYPFLACYMIFSTILVAFAINNMNEARLKRQQILKVSEMLLRNKDVNFLTELDVEGQGVTESEFVLSILLKLGVIDEEQDISQWRSKFRALSGNKPRLSVKEVHALRGTDALDSTTQIKDLMIRSGLSLDVMETASISSVRSPYSNMFSINAPNRLVSSVDRGTAVKGIHDAKREDDRAGLMLHSENAKY